MFLHLHGMAHRDIKDDNFLIRKKYLSEKDLTVYEVALIDFGLAGSLNKSNSLADYRKNSYRDIANI